MSRITIKVLGSIASGKTTLARAVSESLDLTMISEQPNANPFLPRMSRESARWCFANQVWYLNEVMNSISSERAASRVFDHSAEEILNIHTPVFAEQGWLDAEEVSLLHELGSRSEAQLKPDAYLWLDAPAAVLADRVLQRGRHADRAPDLIYLERVAKERREFLSSSTVPVLHIRSDLVDFTVGDQRRSICERVSQFLSELDQGKE